MNKQVIIVALLACFVASYALTNEIEEKKLTECLQAKLASNKIGEATIRSYIEKIRKFIKEGDPSKGIPPGDPLDVKDYHLAINNKLINLDSNWTAKSEGASQFQITDLSLSLIGLNLKLTYKLPKVTASGDYSLNLTSSLISKKIFGKGTFNVESDGLEIKITGKIALKHSNGKLIPQIKKLVVQPTLQKFYLNLTGFMNDEDLSKIISETLTNELPTLLPAKADKINEIIEQLLPFVNKMLEGKAATYGVDLVEC